MLCHCRAFIECTPRLSEIFFTSLEMKIEFMSLFVQGEVRPPFLPALPCSSTSVFFHEEASWWPHLCKAHLSPTCHQLYTSDHLPDSLLFKMFWRFLLGQIIHTCHVMYFDFTIHIKCPCLRLFKNLVVPTFFLWRLCETFKLNRIFRNHIFRIYTHESKFFVKYE